MIRLHLSGPGERASYTALSYCWGEAEQFTTTTSTLSSRLAGILPESLPRTIRDAVTVTRGLKIRYLWVDSLCILQDDCGDKLTEIQKMGQIYKNATLTIQAAVSRSVQEGFLRVPECRILIPPLTSMAESMTLSITATSEGLRDRAWTFQEELLSPRKLYFGSNSIVLGCPGASKRYINNTFKDAETLCFPATLPRTIFHNSHRKPRRSLAKNWAEIVEKYSSRCITFHEDRLAALAGIAQEFHNIMTPSDEYWAGMWRGFAIRHLGWRTLRYMSPTKIDIRQCRRPSWSWVPLVDQVPPKGSRQPHIEFDEVMVEQAEAVGWPEAEDPGVAYYKEILGGRLTLRGKLTSFEKPPRSVPSPLRIGDEWRTTINYDMGEVASESDYRYFLLGLTGWKSLVGLILVPDFLGLVPDTRGAYLRIGQFRITASAAAHFTWDVEETEVVIV